MLRLLSIVELDNHWAQSLLELKNILFNRPSLQNKQKRHTVFNTHTHTQSILLIDAHQ